MRNMPIKYGKKRSFHCEGDVVLLTQCHFGKKKVIQKIGLCIGFYDLLESSDGLIGHGTGLVNVNGMYAYIIQGSEPPGFIILTVYN